MLNHAIRLKAIYTTASLEKDFTYRNHYIISSIQYIIKSLPKTPKHISDVCEKIMFKRLGSISGTLSIKYLPKDILKVLDIEIPKNHDESIFSNEELEQINTFIKYAFYQKIKEL